jgi:hypothetical protein
MSTSGGGGARSWSPPRRPSRYESQKRRDWHTFTRYLAAHRPPLELCRCSGAHVLEFLRYLDRFGKTRVHAPLCAAYGGGGDGRTAEAVVASCQCPLRQAWGSLDALVGRLRAAFEERHGARGSGIWTSSQSQQPADGRGVGGGDADAANPFAARAVRLYLRDVRDAQSRARGISYSRKKKKRGRQQDGASAAAGCARPHVSGATTLMPAAALPPAPPPPPPPPPYCLAGVPFEFCDYSTVLGGVTANGAPGFYLPSLFNTFG